MKWPVSKTFSVLMIAVTAGLSLWARAQLPDGPVATHFNAEGVADGFMPRDPALMFGPLMLLGFTLLFWVLPYMQPKTGKLERSSIAYGAAWITVVTAMTLGHVYVLGHALGWLFLQGLTLQPVLLIPGLVFVLLGNFMPKTRHNYVVGVRTPWTLSDERVWDRTHRFAGPVMMLAGIAMIVAAVLVPSAIAEAICLALVLGTALILILSSWVFARRIGTT